MMRNYMGVMLFAFCLVLTGCGGSGITTVPVTGTITVNGEPVQGLYLQFAPGSGDRPSIAGTDENGNYRAQFLKNQYGVTPGPCVVKISYMVGESMVNYLPKEFNEDAANNPELNIEVPPGGIVFDYDVKFKGKLPPP